MPEWFATTLIGAVFAVAGYVGKLLVDQHRERRTERAKMLAELRGLQSLLRAAHALFQLQKNQGERLRGLLKQNHPLEYGNGGPYEDVMARCYPVMNVEERGLHGIIRSTTEHSMRSVNQAMSEWLKKDTNYKSGVVPSGRSRELAKRLFELEIHLLLWHAKYESWIPDHPEHALVYMADENEHGLGFPNKHDKTVGGRTVTVPGVDEEVEAALSELRTKWK